MPCDTSDPRQKIFCKTLKKIRAPLLVPTTQAWAHHAWDADPTLAFAYGRRHGRRCRRGVGPRWPTAWRGAARANCRARMPGARRPTLEPSSLPCHRLPAELARTCRGHTNHRCRAGPASAGAKLAALRPDRRLLAGQLHPTPAPDRAAALKIEEERGAREERRRRVVWSYPRGREEDRGAWWGWIRGKEFCQ